MSFIICFCASAILPTTSKFCIVTFDICCAAYTALEDMRAREMQQNGFSEESNELGEADHCDGCLEETSKGWQPIGTISMPGDRQCTVRCKCTMRYRRLEADGTYTEG